MWHGHPIHRVIIRQSKCDRKAACKRYSDADMCLLMRPLWSRLLGWVQPGATSIRLRSVDWPIV